MGAVVTRLFTAWASSASSVTKRVSLKLGQRDILSIERVGPSELVGDLPGDVRAWSALGPPILLLGSLVLAVQLGVDDLGRGGRREVRLPLVRSAARPQGDGMQRCRASRRRCSDD